MSEKTTTRRNFLKLTGTAACAALLPSGANLGFSRTFPNLQQSEQGVPDYLLRIAASPIEIAPKHIVSTITYNGQFPGPLLRFKEGQPAPKPFHWDYLRFAKAGAPALSPDETFEMTFAKDNAADEGFNRWTINGAAYPMTQGVIPASFHLKQGRRYRIRMRNASDDIHPIHLHRHRFELIKLAGKPTVGLMKDIVIVGGYQEAEVDFVADNPGLTLFHCHQQLHMDFGFMTLFDYV